MQTFVPHRIRSIFAARLSVLFLLVVSMLAAGVHSTGLALGSICSRPPGIQDNSNQDPSSSTSSQTENATRKILFGISGHLRLGCWAELKVEAKAQDPAKPTLSILAPDSNGNEVQFVWKNRSPIKIGNKSYYAGYFKIGREGRNLTIRLTESSSEDSSDSTFYSETVSTAQDPGISIHPGTFSLWVQTGSNRDLSNLVTSNQSDQDNGLQIIRLKNTDLHKLPVSALGWSGFERMVVFANQGFLNQLSSQQTAAIKNWTKNGGRLSVSGTKQLSELVKAGSPFNWLLSEDKTENRTVEISQTRDVSSLEIFAASKTQVFSSSRETLPFLTFEGFQNQNHFQLEEKTVLVYRNFGFGRIDLMGLDFSSSPLKEWKSSPSVIRQWLANQSDGKEPINVSFGYSDITGQMRTALEKFPSVSLISFTVVMSIILFFLICCALDYFLLRNVLKNVQLTWLTLPLYVSLFTGLAIWIFYNQKSQQMQANQVEVIDILESSGEVRGRVWNHIYSPTAKDYSVSYQPDAPFGIQLNGSLISWEGLPGVGLGGMRTKNQVSSAPSSYDIFADWPLDTNQNGSNLESDLGKIQGIQIPLASTASLTGTWKGQLDPRRIGSQLQHSARLDRLTGRFTNPLDIRLENCYLIYGHWAYRFDRPIEPGAEVDIQTDTTAISITRWLTQKKELEDASVVTPWDPTSVNMQRILELMMFNRLGGGRDYVRLTNRYRSELDLSHLPTLGKAVFLGRTDKAATKWNVDGKPLDDQTLQRKATAIRMVLPVKLIDEKQ